MRIASILVALLCPGLALAAPPMEIARGESWVSPYWGYSAPKIVTDGTTWYTTGLWGMDPDTATGTIYGNDGTGWKEGARLPEIYQPAALALDPQGRLLVAYNRTGAPLVLKRAFKAGDCTQLEELPAPPGDPEGYYLGLAAVANRVYLAWIHGKTYTMYLATLDLDSLEWSAPVVVQRGQVESKPKTAWTYPILYPDSKGLHLVATNCPDGGEGNTYNEVWYLFYPNGASKPSVRERVAECVVGYIAYASDMVVRAEGTVHIAYMYNVPKYGDPLPEDSAPAGTYHAWRDATTGRWHSHRFASTTIASFYEGNNELSVVTAEAGVLQRRLWRGASQDWTEPVTICEPEEMPVSPGFFDVVAQPSGSKMPKSLALVADGLLPNVPGTRVLLSLFPD